MSIKFYRHTLLSLIILLGNLLCVVACQKSETLQIALSNGQKLQLKNTETIATVLSSEVPSLDWLKSSDSNSTWIEEQIMDGLVSFDLSLPKLSIQPSLAERWEKHEQGRVWIFYLRPNVYWTDGVPFDASHVLDAFARILNPQTGAIAVDNIFPIKNAKKYYEGELKDFSQVGVEVVSPLIIRFELEKPMSFFPMILTHHTTFPVRLDVINKFPETWTSPNNIVTLGAYKLSHWQHDNFLILERNEKYWRGPSAIRNIIFYVVEKKATALRMFDLKKLDFIRDLPTTEIPRLKQTPTFYSHPGLRLYYYGFKIHKKPFDQVKARRALAMAIDRKEVVRTLGGDQMMLSSWIPQGILGHEMQLGLPYDPQKARNLWKEVAGDVKTVVLGFNSEEKHQRVAENIQAQLKKNLNIHVELKNEEWKSFLTGLLSSSHYSLFRLGWVADYPDPHSFLSMMASYSANNRTGWKNSEFDQLVESGLATENVHDRINIYKKAQKILLEEDVPVIPLFADVNQVLVSSRIQGFQGNTLDAYHFRYWSIKK